MMGSLLPDAVSFEHSPRSELPSGSLLPPHLEELNPKVATLRFRGRVGSSQRFVIRKIKCPTPVTARLPQLSAVPICQV